MLQDINSGDPFPLFKAFTWIGKVGGEDMVLHLKHLNLRNVAEHER